MNAPEETTASASASTPPISRHPPRNEEELLDQEAALARLGLHRRLQQIGSDLRDVADVETHVRRHPLAATGIALAGGVLAGNELSRLVSGQDSPRQAIRRGLAPVARLARMAVISTLAAQIGAQQGSEEA